MVRDGSVVQTDEAHSRHTDRLSHELGHCKLASCLFYVCILMFSYLKKIGHHRQVSHETHRWQHLARWVQWFHSHRGRRRICWQAQAQELAKYFASLPETERPTIILSSPFCECWPPHLTCSRSKACRDRCLQTAQPISDELGLPIFVDHGSNHLNKLYACSNVLRKA